MLEIKTHPKTNELFVNVSGTVDEILVELASAVGAILTRPQCTDASIDTFDKYYKKAIKHYRKEEQTNEEKHIKKEDL